MKTQIAQIEHEELILEEKKALISDLISYVNRLDWDIEYAQTHLTREDGTTNDYYLDDLNTQKKRKSAREEIAKKVADYILTI